jgi:uncharacterized protein (TIGR03790 family)
MVLQPGASLRGQERGQEVVVIYNAKLPESREVAEHYAERRSVPAAQVWGLDLPETETISRAQYRIGLEHPLRTRLEREGLLVFKAEFQDAPDGGSRRIQWRLSEAKIRYLVLCYGVPLRIEPDPTSNESVPEEMRTELRRNEAAVDSELAVLPLPDELRRVTGPLNNPVFGATNASLLGPVQGALMVARVDGPTPGIARALVDRAIEAEEKGLWGRAYVDLRGLPEGDGYRAGDDWLRMAATLSERHGMTTVVDEKPKTFAAGFPMSHIAFYAGWYDGTVSGPFTRAEVEFMAGAVAYHLHSYSAETIRDAGKRWVGPLLAKGATAVVGTVYEPYLPGTPDIGALWGRMLLSGYTFGEAAYAAQRVLSWQTTVVGDPLYRPFGVSPQELHGRLEREGSGLIEWSHLLVADRNLALGFPVAETIRYLENIDTTPTSAVLLERLGELYREVEKKAASVDALRKAIEQEPSPLQRIRIYHTLAGWLAEDEQMEPAFEAHQRLIELAPDHPDRLEIYRVLLGLARQLGRGDEAARYEAEVEKLATPTDSGGATR